MANTQGVPTYNGYRTRAMGVLYPASGIFCALFFASATRGPSDATYTTTGEATGTGYSAGGVAVTSTTVPAITGAVTYWTPAANVSFGTITITAFDCAMFYDSGASNANLGVFTFGSQTLVAAPFSLTMPTNDSTNALVRWTWS